MQIGKKSSREIIAKYCFFLNMVRLNGTLNLLYLPKRRKGAYLFSFGLLPLSGRFTFSVSVLELELVFRLMVWTLLPAGSVTRPK